MLASACRSNLAVQKASHSKPERRQRLEHVERGHGGAVGKIENRVDRREQDSPSRTMPLGRVANVRNGLGRRCCHGCPLGMDARVYGCLWSALSSNVPFSPKLMGYPGASEVWPRGWPPDSRSREFAVAAT